MSALRAVSGDLAKPSAARPRSIPRGISRALRAAVAKRIVSRTVSKKRSISLTTGLKTEHLNPDRTNKAAVNKILAGFRRPDQPYITGIKSENSKSLSKQNIKYSRRDFEKVLSVMRKQKMTLNEACKKYNLPGKGTILRYAELNPGFRKKLLDTYYSLPYAAQARADMLSPQFYRDMESLKRRACLQLKSQRRWAFLTKQCGGVLKKIV